MLPRPDNRFFVGVGGSGKSYLALSQSASFPRVLICDPNGEADYAEGALVVEDRGELVALLTAPGPLRLCWRGFDRYGEEAAFEWANRAALAAGGLLVMWDETDFFAPYFRKQTSFGYKLWNAGRHADCRVFAIARSPFAIPRTLTRNMTRAAIFRAQEPSDLRYWERLIGREAAAKLPGLAPFTALDWTPETAVVKKSPYR